MLKVPSILRCTEEGEFEEALPFTWAICSGCSGHGKSSAYLGCITVSDRQCGGIWEDDDAFKDYMRGAYDRTCDQCEGLGRVMVADQSKMTKAQRKQLREDQELERQMRAEEAAERRAGC